MRRKKYFTEDDPNLEDDDILEEEYSGEDAELEQPQTIIFQDFRPQHSCRCRKTRRCHRSNCLFFTAFVAFACITFFTFKK